MPDSFRGLWRPALHLPAWLLLATVGCGGSAPPSPPSHKLTIENTAPGLTNVSTHDVGQVIAGEVVSHEFTFTNSSAEALSIAANEDIIKNCGCTELTPAARTLPPGGSTTVKMAVNTTGKDGPLDYGGSITWTAASGAKRTTQFVLRGRAVSALVCDPPMVRFEDADLRAGAAQELKFSGNVSVDWATARVSSSSPLVCVSDWKPGADGATCRGYGVRCRRGRNRCKRRCPSERQ